MRKAKLFFLVLIIISFKINSNKIDNGIGQILRGFNGNFESNISRTGVSGVSPNFLLNPGLTYKEKFSSLIELYNYEMFDNISNSISYKSINFVTKEQNIFKFKNIQFGINYSEFSVDSIEEYSSDPNVAPINSDDKETLLVLNINFPLNIKRLNFNIGSNLKYYTHSISDLDKKSIALDLGGYFPYKNHGFGISFTNILSQKIKYNFLKENLPFQIKTGYLYHLIFTENINMNFNLDYTFNTKKTIDDLVAYSISFNMKDLVNKNYDLSFILGADDIYIKYSFGIALLVKKNFKLGFGYSVNKNSELGDNTSLMLGWNFGQLELKKHEKYAKLEEQGEELYQKGKWNEALVKWKKAYEIYPQKITKAKTSYNLLSNEIKKRIKYSEKLFLKNESYFEKGKFHFFNKRYNKAIQYFSKIKYNDDEKNSVIFDKANLFIEKITKIFQGDKTTKLLKKEILEKENQEKNSLIKKRKISKKFEKEIIEVINNFIKLDRPDMAENHLLRFYELLSDTSIKQIKKSIFNKQISLTNREKLLEQFDVESKKLKDLYFTQKYPEVIDFFVKLEKKYKLYDFIDLSKLRMFFNLAKSKIDMQLSEKNSLKNYDPEKDYMTAAKFYLNYLKSNDIRELEKSIKLFENILKVYPEHNCKKDYLRAKAIYRSLTE